MKRTSTFTLAALAALSLGAVPVAHAQTTIDQSQTASPNTVNQSDTTLNPIGQSFTPTLASLNFVTLAFDNVGGTAPTAKVDIISGDGTSGTVLGTSPVTPVSYFTAGTGSTTTFNFSAPVVLTPGSAYTIRIDPVASSASVDFTYGYNPYPGGQAYFSGFSQSTSDLYFVEGVKVAAPEPSAWAAFAVGILGLGALTLHARKRPA